MKSKLTKRTVDLLKFEGKPGSPFYVWDENQPSFGVRVYESGAKAYVVAYYVNGRKKIIVLGKTHQITLQQAQQEALKHFGSLVQGVDLSERKKEETGIPTVSKFSERFIDEYSKKYRRSWSEDQRRFLHHINPIIGNKPLSEITRSDIVKVHRRLGDRKIEANRCVELLRLFFNIVLDWGILPKHIKFVNPALRLKNIKHKEYSRKRTLSIEELQKFGVELNKEMSVSPIQACAIAFGLHVGLRIRAEALRATWKDYDPVNRVLNVPAEHSKNKKPLRYHLSNEAIEILNRVRELHSESRIFPVESVRYAFKRIRERAEIPDIQPHDLRRSCATMMINSGIDPLTVSRFLNHSGIEITAKTYAFTADSTIQSAASEFSKNLIRFIDIEDKSKELDQASEGKTLVI